MRTCLLIATFLIATIPFANGDLENARRLADEGDYQGAATEFVSSADQFVKRNEPLDAATALVNAAACLKMSGDISAATRIIDQAEQLARPGAEPKLKLQIQAQKGSVLCLGKEPAKALPILQEASGMARTLGNLPLLADIENDLGITHSALLDHPSALRSFAAAESHARQIGDHHLAARARQNHLVSAFRGWDQTNRHYQRSLEFDSFLEAIERDLIQARGAFLDSLQASRTMIGSSSPSTLAVFHTLTAGLAAQRFGLHAEGFLLLRQGLKSAQRLGDLHLERSALLALAEAYLTSSQPSDALAMLAHARLLSGQPDPGQTARLEILTSEALHQTGASSERTIAALQRAVKLVDNLRSDLVRTQEISDLGRPFREHTGRPYLLLADHYLRQATRQPDRRQELYREARDVIESFKASELQDFFRDDCVNLTQQRSIELAGLDDPAVATLYAIPLDDRVELLLSHRGTVHRGSSPMPAPRLAQLAQRFRHDLESDYGSPAAYFEESEALYDTLIRPVLAHLKRENIRHLIFVPDGALGTIPLAALFNRESERYLLEEFSLSVAPSLSLISGDEVDAGNTLGLLVGVSEAVEGFPALPEVEGELQELTSLYPKHLVRLNRQFTAAQLAADLQESPARVVHIACHGEFKGHSSSTFLTAAGGERIYLDDLEKAIRPRKFRGQPVELLCLSACRTAAGDDRAALGLAGAAVKSGSRSVVASLWYVQSRATSRLMIDFHRNLLKANTTKAEALRQAQLAFLREDPLAHPRLWAPFILIGNWK